MSHHDYYMEIARAVRTRGTCVKKQVGAVLVKGDRIIGTGYNGTASGLPNCNAGGCGRCNSIDRQYDSGHSYDLCVCVHAESNALLTAARFGVPVDGAIVYSTVQPCFTCSKELLQAGVLKAYFEEPWIDDDYKPREREDYIRLQGALHATPFIPEQKIETPNKTGAVRESSTKTASAARQAKPINQGPAR